MKHKKNSKNTLFAYVYFKPFFSKKKVGKGEGFNQTKK